MTLRQQMNIRIAAAAAAAALALLVTSGPSLAQDTSKSCLTVPTELNGYRVMGTKVFEDSANGTSYSFSNGSSDRVTLFVYPVRAESRLGNDPRDWVAAEAKRFKALFPAGVQRGWWQSYVMAFDHADSVAVAGQQIPGYLVAGATRRGDVINVELEYVFGICDRFVKMRATLASATWQESPFPTFAKDLAAYLRQH